jgi:hypothetical protein
MFGILAPIIIAQAPTPAPQEVIIPQEVRPLPGHLNQTPVFNSNSPELVLNEGILLSTFPPEGKTHPEAHLNYPLGGVFDLFTHHIAKAPTPEDLRTLYVGVIVHNPHNKAIKLDLSQGASYLSQPDAPFIKLPSFVDNNEGNVYAGPGGRVMMDLLRGNTQASLPNQIVIEPHQSQMLLNLPIPVSTLTPPINGRSTYLKLFSDDTVYVASLALFAPLDENGNERAPTLAEWENLLNTGALSSPRDKVPTPPGTSGSLIYGRVAGVSQGSEWKTYIFDNEQTQSLTIPAPGEAFSYGISTLVGGTYGTGQVETAPMLVRYPDTAYAAHGNYGVHYDLTFPLYNPTNEAQTVTLALQTPVKQDRLNGGLTFLEPPSSSVFFRGTVKVKYRDERGFPITRYVHLVQTRGQQGEPLITLEIPPQNTRLVSVELLYPPDATPPQVITVNTLE